MQYKCYPMLSFREEFVYMEIAKLLEDTARLERIFGSSGSSEKVKTHVFTDNKEK